MKSAGPESGFRCAGMVVQLILSLDVCHGMLCCLLPEGRRVSIWWAGQLPPWRMQVVLSLHLVMWTSPAGTELQPMALYADFASCCRTTFSASKDTARQQRSMLSIAQL